MQRHHRPGAGFPHSHFTLFPALAIQREARRLLAQNNPKPQTTLFHFVTLYFTLFCFVPFPGSDLFRSFLELGPGASLVLGHWKLDLPVLRPFQPVTA